MANEPIHPLDAAEIELRKAARAFTRHDVAVNGTSSDRDITTHQLKAAARAYAEVWVAHVRRPRKASAR